jgi:hypothetical protein
MSGKMADAIYQTIVEDTKTTRKWEMIGKSGDLMG